MLSYLVGDVDTISEIYEGLSAADMKLIVAACRQGAGVRVFQDGALQDEESGDVILDTVDGGLLDEADFRAEAEDAGGQVEAEPDDELQPGCLCQLS